jgi:hypothetical protein
MSNSSLTISSDVAISGLKMTKSGGSIAGGTLQNVTVTDSMITLQSPAKIAGGTKPIYIELAEINGYPTITGSPEIIGIRSGGVEQKARVEDGATIGGTAKISGIVSGQAIVRGSAEVHGQATVTGDCIVEGTAKMISGRFTTGHFTDGEWSGGDEKASPMAQLRNAVSDFVGGMTSTASTQK